MVSGSTRGQVAGVGVTVGVAVGHVEEEDEVVAAIRVEMH